MAAQKVKRPLSSFILYSNAVRQETHEEFPDEQPSELAKIIGMRWHALSDAKKKPYVEEAARLQAKYKAKCQEIQRAEQNLLNIVTKQELRQLCLKNSLTVSGNKRELLDRLMACIGFNAVCVALGDCDENSDFDSDRRKQLSRKLPRQPSETVSKNKNNSKTDTTVSTGNSTINIHMALPVPPPTTRTLSSKKQGRDKKDPAKKVYKADKLKWSKYEVAEWVESLDKKKFRVYAHRLIEEEVTGELMDTLDDKSLEEIVPKHIHRKRILLRWNKL